MVRTVSFGRWLEFHSQRSIKHVTISKAQPWCNEVVSFNSVARGADCEWISKGSKIGGNVLVEVNTAVRKLAELSSLLDLCSAKIQSASAISLSCVRIPLCPGHIRPPPTGNPSHPHLIIDHACVLLLRLVFLSLGDVLEIGLIITYQQPPRRSKWKLISISHGASRDEIKKLTYSWSAIFAEVPSGRFSFLKSEGKWVVGNCRVAERSAANTLGLGGGQGSLSDG